MLTASLLLAAAALICEALFGYPQALYRAIGHPVTWIGALIRRLDGALNREGDSFLIRKLCGCLALALLLAITGGVALGLQWALTGWAGFVLLALLAASLPAQRSLHAHVADVAQALESEGLEGGRRAVSMIVGRNTSVLDEAGVARAAIESLAENFSDGVVAPLFWMTVGGLPGGVLYKAANTADSMIGHRTKRHKAFGWAAARFDDLINLPASRLTALFLLVAASLTPGLSAREGWRALWRDAGLHRSPNAGWPEAAMAGALGLKLAGPRVYGTELTQDAFMGSGRAEATAADIRSALRLYSYALMVQALTLFALAALVIWRG
jgi:adenosylcobinamide-phosphate synthase